jgi:hypothetical protein
MVNCWLPGNPLRPATLGTENIRVYGERRCGTAGVYFNIEFPQFDKVEKPEASVKDLL